VPAIATRRMQQHALLGLEVTYWVYGCKRLMGRARARAGVITVPASIPAIDDAAVPLGKKGNSGTAGAASAPPAKPTLKTWVHSLFQVCRWPRL